MTKLFAQSANRILSAQKHSCLYRKAGEDPRKKNDTYPTLLFLKGDELVQ